jgi:hypothetical protein
LPFRQFYHIPSQSKFSITAESVFKASLKGQVLKTPPENLDKKNVEENWQPLPEQGRGCPR